MEEHSETTLCRLRCCGSAPSAVQNVGPTAPFPKNFKQFLLSSFIHLRPEKAVVAKLSAKSFPRLLYRTFRAKEEKENSAKPWPTKEGKGKAGCYFHVTGEDLFLLLFLLLLLVRIVTFLLSLSLFFWKSFRNSRHIS